MEKSISRRGPHGTQPQKAYKKIGKSRNFIEEIAKSSIYEYEYLKSVNINC